MGFEAAEFKVSDVFGDNSSPPCGIMLRVAMASPTCQIHMARVDICSEIFG